MKRCPACGFRADDQTCPLCGVRMHADGASVQTHAHQQKGERCALPNREAPQQKEEQYHPQNSRRSARGNTSASAVIVVIILFMLLRGCMGIV